MDTQRVHNFFKFDDPDLDANHEGRFSENQMKVITEADRQFKNGMRRHGIPLILVALLGPVIAITSGRFLGLAWILIWGILWTLIWGFFGWGLVQGSYTKTDFKLVTAKGVITVLPKEGPMVRRKASIWNDLRVGRKRFELQADLSDAFDPGDEGVVYYEKDLQLIVGIDLTSTVKTPVEKPEKAVSIDSASETAKLMKHFKFNETDLMSNQGGYLSERQKKRIIKEAGSGRKGAILLGIVLILVASAGPLSLIPILSGTSDFISKLTFGIGFGLIWALLWGAPGILLVVLGISSAPQVTLLTMKGRANLVRGETSGSTHRSSVYYDLNLNGHEFDGDKDFINVFVQDAEYMLYYTKGAEEIVAAEFISAPN